MRLADTTGGLVVKYHGTPVGTMARNADGLCVFQYDAEWLQTGFPVNPYSLPLANEVFVPSRHPFGGLFGVFADSLPDGWGALLLDRKLRAEGVDPSQVGPLVKLSIVGSSGRGALTYEPQSDFPAAPLVTDLDQMAAWCADILADRPADNLDAVFAAGGSSAGARPKAYVQDDCASWLVKFPSSIDSEGIGRLEHDFMQGAQECGIEVPEFKLFPSRICDGFFATRRFDIDEAGARVHMVTASGVVEVTHREPSLDYESLFQISSFLGGGQSEAKRLFRLMCFNVFAHNQDDHSNNFSWLYQRGAWRLSPAYDLTYTTGFGRQHATSVLGNGNPTPEDLLGLAREVGLSGAWAKRTADEIRVVCHDLLIRNNLPT